MLFISCHWHCLLVVSTFSSFPPTNSPSVLISQNSLVVVGVVYERYVVAVVCWCFLGVFGVCVLCVCCFVLLIRMVCSLSPLILVELRMNYILTPCICSIVVVCRLSLIRQSNNKKSRWNKIINVSAEADDGDPKS